MTGDRTTWSLHAGGGREEDIGRWQKETSDKDFQYDHREVEMGRRITQRTACGCCDRMTVTLKHKEKGMIGWQKADK